MRAANIGRSETGAGEERKSQRRTERNRRTAQERTANVRRREAGARRANAGFRQTADTDRGSAKFQFFSPSIMTAMASPE